MDKRRFSTADIMGSGILSTPPPKTDIPQDVECVGSDYEFSYIGREAVREHIEAGKVVDASNYFGIPSLWKDGDVFRGVLLQYRAVTEDKRFEDIEEALDWFEETASATSG